MSSRRIQAMAKLIEDLEAVMEPWKPCDEHGGVRCRSLFLLKTYRDSYKEPKARSARASSPGSNPQ